MKMGGFCQTLMILSCVILISVIFIPVPVNSMDEFHQVFCEPRLLFPVWYPQENLSVGDRFVRGLVYFMGMLYMFIGVSILSERCMASIDIITSKEKKITIKNLNGETQILVVRECVWNETITNLTLMVLGTSTPQILLIIIELYGKHFEAGDLGPGTIIGSGAFNLFIIIAICVYVIPSGEIRRIKHLHVFIVTAIWFIFAYLWLFFILTINSPTKIDVWEGFLTLCFYPFTVVTAYLADRRDQYMSGGYRMNRRDYIQILNDLKKRHPTVETDQLETMALKEIFKKSPKSRAFYRMQATRKLMGRQNLMRKVLQEHAAASEQSSKESIIGMATKQLEENAKDDAEYSTRVYFDPGHYTVMKRSVGQFQVTVMRDGGDLGLQVLVDYKTDDGIGCAEANYIPTQGTTLKFTPFEKHKTISFKVLDDNNVSEENEHFYIQLFNLRFLESFQVNDEISGRMSPTEPPSQVKLISPFLATVMILNDDHYGGTFNIGNKNIHTVESIGVCEVKVNRLSGGRGGRVEVPYTTLDGTAKAGKDYVQVKGELIFENNETEKIIEVQILEENSYEKDVLFYVEIAEPHPIDDLDAKGKAFAGSMKDKKDFTRAERTTLAGWPKLGSDTRAMIRIKENKEFKNTVDNLLQRTNAPLLVGTSSWKEQFLEALTVNGGDDDVDGGGDDESQKPSWRDYVMHFFMLFWKLIFAFVPPTGICGGYVTFAVSILGIGALTAAIGDLASYLGCTIGLKDSITAITIVVLGISAPETFASKVAAIQDECADASISHLTGSNAVNVFLGIGVAWTIAAIYHTYFKNVWGPCEETNFYYTNCRHFHVYPESLAYPMTILCGCAVVAIMIMLLRRLQMFGGGELGGPARFKYATAILLVCLWIFCVIISSLEAYGIIQGF